MKQNDLLLIGLGLGVLYLMTRQSDTTKPPGTVTKDSFPFPLKYGSAGNEVKSLQSFLNYSSNYGLKVDGIFGPKTEAAVKSELSGLPGIVNPLQVPQWYFDTWIKGKF